MAVTFRIKKILGASLGGAARLSLGSLTGQLLAFLTTVLIARLYSPADVGVLSAVLAVALTLGPLVTLGLQVAIVPAHTDADAIALARLALLTTALFSVVTACVLVFAPTPTGSLTDNVLLVNIFVPSMLLVIGAFAVLNQLALRNRQYSAIAYRGVLQSASIGATQVGGYFVLPPPVGLFFGEVAGRLVGIMSLIPSARRQWLSISGTLPQWRSIMHRYRDAVAYFLPAATLEMATLQAVFILVATQYGDEQAGYVGLTIRVLIMPVVLIGTAVGQVLSTELSHRRRAGDSANSLQRVRQLLFGLSVLSLTFAVGTVALAPWAFQFLFGQEWAPAGELARYLAFPMAIGLIWNSMSTVFTAYLRFRMFLVITTTRFIASVTAGLLLWQIGAGWVAVVVGMFTSTAVVQIFGIAVALRLVARYRGDSEDTLVGDQ